MADDSQVRLTGKDRAQLRQWIDLPGGAASDLVDRIEDILNSHLLTVKECADWPSPKDCKEALDLLDDALASVLNVLNTNGALVALDGVADNAEQMSRRIEAWRLQVVEQGQSWASIVKRGRPPKAYRDMLLIHLLDALEEAQVDREDQPFIARYACGLVGVSLPESSKLDSLLAVIRHEQT